MPTPHNTSMLNLYQDIRSSLHFNKFEIGDLLFAEYTCPLQQRMVGLWAEMDYLVHVVSGRKVWHTAEGDWPAEAGQTIFFRKGAAVVEQFFDHDFCLLLFFVPDAFVRDVVRELVRLPGAGPAAAPPAPSPAPSPDAAAFTALRVQPDVGLAAFLQSMIAYFARTEPPSEPLLRLKLEELVTSVVTGTHNPRLAAYFRSLADHDRPSLRAIMESNYRFRLTLEEFAALCHRSLSSFKRDFREAYGESPGKWLVARRLDHAAALLRGREMSVTEIAFECGFEDASHFSRAFRARFGTPPSAFRRGG